jgi:hypothetical protein
MQALTLKRSAGNVEIQPQSALHGMFSGRKENRELKVLLSLDNEMC